MATSPTKYQQTADELEFISQQLKNVTDFWFKEDKLGIYFNKKWFSSELDDKIKSEFGHLLTYIDDNKYIYWKSELELLAVIIIYDQFTRNVHRGTKNAYKNDQQALTYANIFFNNAFDSYSEFNLAHIIFAIMPFRHSEKLEDQKFVLEKIKQMKPKYAHGESSELFNKFEIASLKSYQIIKENGSFKR